MHTRHFNTALLSASVLLALALAGCRASGADAEPLTALREISSPAGLGSGEANLFAANGRIYLSWLERSGQTHHALRFAAWEDTTWSAPRTIAEGENFFVNWADFPSLVALPDGRLAAHWLVRSGPGTYSYDVHIAQSADGGDSWSAPVVPHTDGTQTEHGFVSLFPLPNGRLGATWLDGRDFEGQAEHGGSGVMTLRHAALGAAGEIGEETLLDDRVCDCCQTATALTSRGPVTVYRDRSPDEIRDIYAVRWIDGRWTPPAPVHRDGWYITGCPVNGPAIAADGESAAVAWFTAAADTPRVMIAFATDAGASFGRAIRVDDGEPTGRVDVLLLDRETALVSWLEQAGEAAEIRVRRVRASGEAGRSSVVSRSSAARASGFPRMARSGDSIFFAWTDPSGEGQVRTAIAERSDR
jgi:hypothetical protein